MSKSDKTGLAELGKIPSFPKTEEGSTLGNYAKSMVASLTFGEAAVTYLEKTEDGVRRAAKEMTASDVIDFGLMRNAISEAEANALETARQTLESRREWVRKRRAQYSVQEAF